jgi:uncharacterized membrane protein YfcA
LEYLFLFRGAGLSHGPAREINKLLSTSFLFYTLSGLIVGLVVGLTGVGGGSLMTPILVYLGIPPLKAVGTDLLYASVTKLGGVLVHARKKNIEWRVVGLLSLGSLPAAAMTLAVLSGSGMNEKNSGAVIKLILGIALLVSATAMLLKQFLRKQHVTDTGAAVTRGFSAQAWATVGMGWILGTLVTLSSVGAGALGAAVMIFLYPRLSTTKIVGIDIAHAVPLTLLAGLGHLALGSVNLGLLASLLLGSLPGIWLGSLLSPKMPDRVLRPVMAGLLALIGVTML